MRRPARRSGAAVAAVVSGLALALLPASSASAVTVPDWPTSRVPVGCPITGVANGAAGPELTYGDGITPTVSGWTANGSRTRVSLKPGSNPFVIRYTAQQLCGGVGGVVGFGRSSTGGAPASPLVAVAGTAATSNAFDSVWANSATLSAPLTGWVEIPIAGTGPRYDSFVLDDNFGLVSKTDAAGGIQYVTGTWSKQRVYITLKTTHTVTATKTSVRRGSPVTFTTTFKAAGASAYVAKAGSVVKFQTKLPGKAWVTRATRTTTSTGRASYTFSPTATQAWRWVHTENITTTPYTAASTSVVKTITVS